jgi:hypothetical protein
MTKEIGTTFKALCKALNISMALASHWASTDRREIRDLNKAAELLVAGEFPIDDEHLSMATTSWEQHDWRGRKGETGSTQPLAFAEHCLLWWERWKKTQGVLEKGQRRPRWRGKFDSLRAEAAALEDARALRAVKPSEWKQLANQFRKVNRITAAKYYQGMVKDGR